MRGGDSNFDWPLGSCARISFSTSSGLALSGRPVAQMQDTMVSFFICQAVQPFLPASGPQLKFSHCIVRYMNFQYLHWAFPLAAFPLASVQT